MGGKGTGRMSDGCDRRRVLPRRVLLGALAAGGAAVLAACGEQASSASPTPDASETAAASSLRSFPAGDRRAAPDFEFTPYQGQGFEADAPVQFSAILARGKPVVLNFWAGLCPPCRVEMPDLQEAYEATRDRVTLIGLDVGPFVNLGSREEGQALVVELGVEYPIGTTSDPMVMQNYRILGMPSTLFIAPSGEIVRQWAGILNRESLLEFIAELEEASRT